MKHIRTIISLALAFAFIIAPVSVFAEAPTPPCAHPVEIGTWRGCEPIVTTGGTVSIDKYSAIVSAYFSSNGADFNSNDKPALSIEYGLSSSAHFDKSSDTAMMVRGNRNASFALPGLVENKTYKYRAVLSWVGGVKYGEIKTFVAQKQITGSTTGSTSSGVDGTTTPTTTPATTNTVASETVAPATGAGVTTSGGFLGLFGKKVVTPAARFKNVDERSGFRLSIDDGETNINQGDTVTLKVRYENNNTKAYDKAVIEIYIPEQFTFVSSNKGIYDRIDHVVSIDLGEFPAGGFGTAIVIAEATGKSGNLDQAIAQASMNVAGITLKVADIDEYNGSGKGGVLGASASGSFLPGSIIGWIVLLIILAGLVIVGRRYFVKKDY